VPFDPFPSASGPHRTGTTRAHANQVLEHLTDPVLGEV
jgi:hypothetical protein